MHEKFINLKLLELENNLINNLRPILNLPMKNLLMINISKNPYTLFENIENQN